jgi:hypothetical protein
MNEHTKPRGGPTVGPPDVSGPETAAAPPEDERPAGDGLPTEVKIELGRPIATHYDKQTTFLVFREPTALDIDAVGNPVSNDFSRGWPPLPVIDSKKMTLMMARLANISPKSILEMRARDWATCSLAVQIFFLPDLGRL